MNQPTRSLWPISIAIFFAVAITAAIAFLIWAVQQRDDLVARDYYAQEVQYQKHLDQLNRSQALARQSLVTYDPARQDIVITLPFDKSGNVTGTVRLYRPSDARLDREIALAVDAGGVQRVATQELRDGLWKVRVQWRFEGEDYFVDQPVIVSSAPRTEQAATR